MRLINLRPGRPLALFLMLLPFVAVFVLYSIGSEIRLAENPSDKLLPAPSTIVDTAGRLITQPDRRSERILFWVDTAISLQRLAMGVGLAALIALVVGILIGLLPYIRALMAALLA